MSARIWSEVETSPSPESRFRLMPGGAAAAIAGHTTQSSAMITGDSRNPRRSHLRRRVFAGGGMAATMRSRRVGSRVGTSAAGSGWRRRISGGQSSRAGGPRPRRRPPTSARGCGPPRPGRPRKAVGCGAPAPARLAASSAPMRVIGATVWSVEPTRTISSPTFTRWRERLRAERGGGHDVDQPGRVAVVHRGVARALDALHHVPHRPDQADDHAEAQDQADEGAAGAPGDRDGAVGALRDRQLLVRVGGDALRGLRGAPSPSSTWWPWWWRPWSSAPPRGPRRAPARGPRGRARSGARRRSRGGLRGASCAGCLAIRAWSG